jgi:hypothetical protein
MPDIKISIVGNTATFDDAAIKTLNTARRTKTGIEGAFNGINISEARGTIGLLGEDIGVHLPRHVQTFLAHLPGIGAAMEAAFPVFAVIAIGVAVVEAAEKLAKWREETQKVAADQTKLGTAINNTFNSLDEKLLQAGIHSDELNNNHLAALKKQLELINMQSMSELAHSFDVIAKAADVVFSDLKSHWYTFGIGADGAKHALTQFQTQYDSLLAQGKDKEASDLLAGTLQSAEKVLAFQKQYTANQMDANTGKGPTGAEADYNKFEQAALALKQAGVGVTEKEVQSQEALVSALQAQVEVQGKVNALKQAQDKNARQQSGNEIKGDTSKVLETQLQEDLARIARVKAAAIEAYVAMGHSIDEAKAHEDAMFADSELQAHLDYYEKVKGTAKTAAERQKIAADEQIFMDKAIAQANDQLAATLSKNAADISKLNEEGYKQSEKLNEENTKTQMAQIAETTKAMMQRLNLRRAESDTEAEQAALQQVHSLLRVRDIDTEIEQLKKLKETEAQTDQQKLAYDAAIHNAESRKLQDMQTQLLATNKLSNAFKAFYLGMQQEALQAGQKIKQALDHTFQGLNQNLSQFMVEGNADWRQFAATAIESFIQIGLQYAESKAAMAILDAAFGTKKKAENAAEANSSAATAGANTLADAPWPLNIPASASVFAIGEGYAADAMAERGGVLPNREMLVRTHPQEMILPAKLSNFIQGAAAAASGNNMGGSPMVFAPTIHAVDAEGVDRVLERHGDRFFKKANSLLRSHNMV